MDDPRIALLKLKYPYASDSWCRNILAALDAVDPLRQMEPAIKAADLAWNALICAAVQWTEHMDQWDKFQFDTEYGPVYVSIKLETQYPDSYDRVQLDTPHKAPLRQPVEARAVEAALCEWFPGGTEEDAPSVRQEWHDLMSRAIAAADRVRSRSVVEWQPIETAPKDGVTEVDLWVDGRRATNCHWHLGEWLQWRSDSVDDEPSWHRIESPIAWAKLPAPPPWATETPATPGTSARSHDAPPAEPRWTAEKDALLREVAEWAGCTAPLKHIRKSLGPFIDAAFPDAGHE